MTVSGAAPANPSNPPPPPAPALPLDEWLRLADEATDPHTALDYAQRAVDARPDDPRVQASLQRGVLARLGQDAFVAYMAETNGSYVVSFRNSRPVAVPKARAQPEPYPPAKPAPVQRVWQMVGLMLLGLLPAGLGALALSPLVLSRATAIAADPHTPAREQRSAWVAMVIGTGIGLLGALLALVLLLHIIG